jgi:hypothetical protein
MEREERDLKLGTIATVYVEPSARVTLTMSAVHAARLSSCLLTVNTRGISAEDAELVVGIGQLLLRLLGPKP